MLNSIVFNAINTILQFLFDKGKAIMITLPFKTTENFIKFPKGLYNLIFWHIP